MIKYDKKADALYVRISKRKIVSTKKINKNIFIDLDKDGNLVGIEYLNIYKIIKEKNV